MGVRISLSSFCNQSVKTKASPANCADSISIGTHWRPYRVECTGSLPTPEVKRRRARLVLGWGTAREDLRVLPAFQISECDASCAIQRFRRTSGRVLPALLSSRKLRELVAPTRVRRRRLRADRRTRLLLHFRFHRGPHVHFERVWARNRLATHASWSRVTAGGAGFAGKVLRSRYSRAPQLASAHVV